MISDQYLKSLLNLFSNYLNEKIKELYSGIINNQKIFVLKPLTFMNLSGKAVSEIVNFYKIKLDHTFVIHDDLDLELSKVKIKQGGGNGGHNGCLLYTSPSPRDRQKSRMPSSA